MGHLTTVFSSEEILNHFADVLEPFVRQNQCIENTESNSNSPNCSKTKSMLTASVSGKRSQEVLFVFVALDKMSILYVVC